jgi:hypothetical protein
MIAKSKEIKHQRSLLLPESDHAVACSQALAHWKNIILPLSYGGENAPTYILLRCISPNPKGPPPEGTAVQESLTYKALAKHMYTFLHQQQSITGSYVEKQLLQNCPADSSSGDHMSV